MTEEQKRKLDNWKELHNSILQNIQNSSEELSFLLSKREDAIQELEKIKEQSGEASVGLQSLFQECEIIKRNIVVELEKPEKERIKLSGEKEDHKVFLTLASKKLEDINKNISLLEVEASKSEDRLASIEDVIEELQTKEQVIINGITLYTLEKLEIFEQIQNLLLEKRSLEDKNNIMERENKQLVIDNTKIETETEKKIRSLDKFHENKRKEEQDILRKRKDLLILEGRLRIQFKSIGQNFKL